MITHYKKNVTEDDTDLVARLAAGIYADLLDPAEEELSPRIFQQALPNGIDSHAAYQESMQAPHSMHLPRTEGEIYAILDNMNLPLFYENEKEAIPIQQSTSPHHQQLQKITPSQAGEVSQRATSSYSSIQVNSVRHDFPILQKKIDGKPLIWFDNGATTQKPNEAIDAESNYYRHHNSNIHRGVHTLSQEATALHEKARENIAHFIHASDPSEIIFVKGTTEAINFVAHSYGGKFLSKGDEIILTQLEHHSNILPWQKIARATGAKLKVAPIAPNGDILLDEYSKLLNSRTKIVAMAQVSNAIGTVLPVKEMIQLAHRHGAATVIDGAQSIAHFAIDVQNLDCDFFAFSGHKLFGPTGIGVLYGKKHLLELMPAWQVGGGAITKVTFDDVEYAPLPFLHEPGTSNLAGVIGLSAALDYLKRVGMHAIDVYERELADYTFRALKSLSNVRLIGEPSHRVPIFSFIIDGIAAEGVGIHLNKQGIAVRTGHHCTQPLLQFYGVDSTVRASLAFYNTRDEVDVMIQALRNVR